MPELPPAPPEKRRKLRAPRIHPRWHNVLIAYQWLFGFVGLGILGTVVATLLASGTDHFFTNLQTQLAALFAFVTTYKLATVPVALLLLVLFAISLIAGRQRAQDTADATDAHVVDVATTVAAATAQQAVDDQIGKLEAAAAAAAQAAVRPTPEGVLSPDGLPRASHLFGRDARLDEVLKALQAGEAVNVSALAGQPGIGKTALAAETVAVALERGLFPGGALWLSCRDRHGPDGLAYLWSEIARQLGADDIVRLPTVEQQRSRLSALFADTTKPKVLLAFDNIEPDLDADALVDTLAGGRAALLFTARQAIASARVRSFALDTLTTDAATALFRAQLRQSDSTRPNDADEPLLPAVVAWLDGLPLALELTARYIGTQGRSMQAVQSELERDHLSAGGLDVLRRAIDRSWEVLDPSQRRLFAGLSLLEGASFPRWAALALAAAASATGDDTADAPERDDRAARDAANEALETLVGLSLVEPQADERLRLHPRLREYAAERFAAPALSAPDRKALSDAFLAAWVAYARKHPNLDGMNALDAEALGLMGALKWAHDHGERATLLALARALTTYWYVRGRVADAVLALPWAVDAARRSDSKTDQCFMIHSLAVFQAQTGDRVAARAGYSEALRLARELGDPSAIRVELHGLAVLDAQEGNRAEARAGFAEALGLARELGDPAAQALELYSLGSLDLGDGDLTAARTELTKALALARAVQQPTLIVEAVWWLAELEKRSGNREAACDGFREALVLYEALGHPDAVTRERLAELDCAS